MIAISMAHVIKGSFILKICKRQLFMIAFCGNKSQNLQIYSMIKCQVFFIYSL